MTYSKESQDRIKKIQDLKDAGVIPYAHSLQGKIDISQIQEYSWTEKVRDIDTLMAWKCENTFTTAGRIISSKSHGKLTFAKIRDNSGDIQICFMRDMVSFHSGIPQSSKLSSLEIAGEMKSAYKIAEKFCQVGDYIAVKWDLFETKHGELTIFVSEFQIMSKAVRPLPEKWHGIKDQESIQRQRYLDMIMNDDTYQKFRKRALFLKSIRKFLDDHGFIEIDCPVLDNAASGAAAQPFTTHHNALDIDVYLRICDEIPLKKATAGRFEKVYEMSKVFRNEWIDPSHLQEFTMLEFQAAYWTLEQNMDFAEAFAKYLVESLWIDPKVPVKDTQGDEKIVDFSQDWERINYSDAVMQASWIDVSRFSSEDEDELRKEIRAKGHDWEWLDIQWTATMIDYLYKKVLRPKIVGPAFIYNYPKTMQPLARQSDTNPKIVEQYQVVVNGWEIMKCYSELIDPTIQKANFAAQSDALHRGDEEATSGDEDYLLAMEHGFPPQSGFGMGIERIFAILMQEENLRDVVMFPIMKPLTAEEKTLSQTQLAVSVLCKDCHLEKWQELNTVSHLAASLAGREWKHLFLYESVKSQDSQDIPMNMQSAIMIQEIGTQKEIHDLYQEAQHQGLSVVPFTREMLETSNDTLVQEKTSSQKFDELEFLGIMIFGAKKTVESLTRDLPLYGS